MWTLFFLFPSFVLIGSAGVAILCDERRPLVLLCLGGMVGMVATSIALSILGLLAGIALATWIVFALLALGGLAAAVYWWRSRLWQAGMGVSWKYVVLLLVLAGHFGVLAAVSWQFAVGAGVELDNLFSRSAFTSTIARGNFPVVNPYQPDQLLPYRLAFYVMGAFVARLANQPAPEALTMLNAALFAILFVGAVGMGLAARFGPWRTLLAAGLFLTVGDFQWLQLSQMASLEYSDFNHHTLVTSYLRDSAGPALANSLKKASLSYGHLVVFCGLTFYVYGWRMEGWRRTALALATGVVVGHLAAASETWFAALAAALLADLAMRLAFSRQVSFEGILRLAAAAAALIVTAIVSPGILFARAFGGPIGDPGIRFKGLHVLDYKLGRLDTNGDGLGADVWEPLLQAKFVWLWGLLLIAAPLALLYMWKTRHHLPWLLLLYSGACFSAFFLFTLDHAVDMWRFVYSAVAALGFVASFAVIWLLSALRSVTPLLKHIALLALIGAGALYVGGSIQYSIAIPWLADPRPPVAYRNDVAAVKTFLNRETAVQERMLVLGDAVHWNYGLLPFSQIERAALTAYVAAYSGQHVPTGGMLADRIAYSTDSPQLRRANAAQGKLSAVDLLALDITYLYAASPWLTDLHRAALAEKLARGSLTRVWRAQDADTLLSCRAFLRLDETAKERVTAVTFAEGERVAVPRTPLSVQIPFLRSAGASSISASAEREIVQATVLITVSEPSTIVVESGDGFSLRIEVEDALSLRTPPLEAGSALTVRTSSGSAQVLWLEVYAPIAARATAYAPADLELCKETGGAILNSTSA